MKKISVYSEIDKLLMDISSSNKGASDKAMKIIMDEVKRVNDRMVDNPQLFSHFMDVSLGNHQSLWRLMGCHYPKPWAKDK